MKHVLLCLTFICFVSAVSQNTIYQEYSYAQFFELIEQEKDSVFNLSDALIIYNPKTDTRFKSKNARGKRDENYPYRNDIVIDKAIVLDNVQFLGNLRNSFREGTLVDIHFKKSVNLKDVAIVHFKYCRFDDSFRQRLSACNLENIGSSQYFHYTLIEYSTFKDEFLTFNNCIGESGKISVSYTENLFTSIHDKKSFSLFNHGVLAFTFRNNLIDYKAPVDILSSNISLGTWVTNNAFKSDFISMTIRGQNGSLEIAKNSFSSPVLIDVEPFSPAHKIGWKQFDKGFLSDNSLSEYTFKTENTRSLNQIKTEVRNEVVSKYKDSVRYFNEDAFDEELSLKSYFYSHFKSIHNTKLANQVYIDLKDFETKRLHIEYDENPGFRSYFKWKVNQFLKVFSAYGTEPSLAITFSFYVIILFAFIYLFFPNHWDSHGKHRIMDRYRFFTKYMNKEAGIHEVYLEEKKTELLAAEDFKNYMQAAEKHIPKFFIATAMPLYKWSVSGTRVSAWILKRIDVMKGTWQQLPPSKRIWKSVLLVGAFVIAVAYDVFIKILNALMLSINTFTTLGFGEIPIKGLPRYLAIIQGFIGWFMLTIFSVSLISQLLN